MDYCIEFPNDSRCKRLGAMGMVPESEQQIRSRNGVPADLPTPRRFGVREITPQDQDQITRPRRFGVREITPQDQDQDHTVKINHKITSHHAETHAPTKKLLGKMGVLGSGIDRLAKTTTESIEQHKYAHLANASYSFNDPKRPKHTFMSAAEYIPELEDFRIDHELSNKNAVVLENPVTGEVHISYRGTNPKKAGDLGTDAMIMGGVERSSARFRQAKDLYKRTKAKYGSRKITASGHSLGGGQSLYVAEKFGIEGHHFDPAISVTSALARGSKKARQRIYRTILDPVSGLSPLATIGRKFRKTTLVKTTEDSKNVHGLSQMIQEPEFLKDVNGDFVKRNGKRVPLTTAGGSMFITKKVPFHVSVGKGLGYAADAAYVIMQGVDTYDHIAQDDMPIGEVYPVETSELEFVPGIGMGFMAEGSIEERALGSLGKKVFGSIWRDHPLADHAAALEKKTDGHMEGTTFVTDDGHRYVEVP